MKIPFLFRTLVVSSFLFGVLMVSATAQTVTIDDQTITCGYSPSGRLVASVTGGYAPYYFQWFNSSWSYDGISITMTNNEGLPYKYGTYHVIVTDSLANKDTATITISPSILNISVTPVEQSYGGHAGCYANDGEAEVTISGGTPPYLVIVRWNIGSDVMEELELTTDTIVREFTSLSSYTIDSLYASSYDVTVFSDSGRTCWSSAWIELSPAPRPLVKLTGELYPNGFYTSCDTCSNGTFTINAVRPHGAVNYTWMQVPDEVFPDVFIDGASFSLPYEFKEGHAPQDIAPEWVLYSGTDSVYDQLEADTWYIAFIEDELGCDAYAPLYIERPYVPHGTWAWKGNEADSSSALGTTNAQPLRLLSNDTVRMEVLPTGQIGIGTTDVPSGYLLAVNGKAIMEEVEVKLQGDWPDYVFEEGYDLPPLDSLKRFISLNGHLPGFPSAKTMKERGRISSGQMTTSLVQKVEELTLYILDLQQKVEVLQQQNKELFEHVKQVRSKERTQRLQNGAGQD